MQRNLKKERTKHLNECGMIFAEFLIANARVNNMCPEVSVVIPNYNCVNYLPRAISSALDQKNVAIEIIVIDDGSTDDSLVWLNRNKRMYNQIRVISQTNKGVIAARNRAISEANSRYIAFLDADDYWPVDKLAEQLNFMKSRRACGLSFTNYQHVNTEHKEIVDCFSYWPEFSKHIDPSVDDYQLLPNAVNRILETNVIGTSSVMVKKQHIERAGGFDPTLKSAEDWDCWLRIALDSEVAFTNKISMSYLMRPDSLTANRQQRIDAMYDIVARIVRHEKVDRASYQLALTRILESQGELHRLHQQFYTALRYSSLAFYRAPHIRRFKALLSDAKNLLQSSIIQQAKVK